MNSEVVYAPPPGPPPNHNPVYAPPPGLPPPQHPYPAALIPSTFPHLSPTQAHSLATQGFTDFPIAQRAPLLEAAISLFTASRGFFAQPQERKAQFRVPAAGSEEGWSRVVGEKELLTVRRGGNFCPPTIENDARALWRECGALMQEVMWGIEQSLGMERGALDGVVSAECVMPEAGGERLETLLRMFRYERRADEHDQQHAGKGRLVAEPHRDLGLLSLVIGASPGLEVWDTAASTWIPIEEPPHTTAERGITATLLGGETLTQLTNGRYAPGRHRVFVPPATAPSPDPDAQFRYSLVFALRPHPHARISTSALTTPITGAFSHPLEDVRARELFAAIARTHWNVNTEVKRREAQRLRLQGGKTGSVMAQLQTNEEQEHPVKTGDSHGRSERKGDRKRWSISSLGSNRHSPKEDPVPGRKRWSLFHRILRR